MKETRQESIFDRAETVSALDAAERFAGIEGSRPRGKDTRRRASPCPFRGADRAEALLFLRYAARNGDLRQGGHRARARGAQAARRHRIISEQSET